MKNAKRGDFKVAVVEEHGTAVMHAVTFIDSKVVTILSTADSTETDTMTRQCGNEARKFDAVHSVINYVDFMDGVDIYDGHKARFSLVKGHSWKKWYKKLGFSTVEDLKLNAFFAWRMAKGITNARESSVRDIHTDFMCHMIQELFTTDWSVYDDDSVLIRNDLESIDLQTSSSFASPFHPRQIPQVSDHCSPHSGLFDHNSSGRLCKVCWFELRPNTKQTQYCRTHKVSLCTQAFPNSTNGEFIPSEISADTCWSKFHSYYFPNSVMEKRGVRITLNKQHPIVQKRKKFLETFLSPEEENQIRAGGDSKAYKKIEDLRMSRARHAAAMIEELRMSTACHNV